MTDDQSTTAPATDDVELAVADESTDSTTAEAVTVPAEDTQSADGDDAARTPRHAAQDEDSDADEADEDEDEDSDDAEGDEDSAPAGERKARKSRRGDDADLEREGEVAADFLETLLDIADLDGDIDVDIDGDRAAVSIVDSDEGRVPRSLVGPDGKVLEALQELTRLAVQAETGDRSRLMLDVAGHRAQRRTELIKTAESIVEQVRSSGERAPLEPMSAFERKVVHDAVLAAGLSSESEGAEPRRYVVVLPAS